jgi:hypothetical protein
MAAGTRVYYDAPGRPDASPISACVCSRSSRMGSLRRVDAIALIAAGLGFEGVQAVL